MNSSFTFFLSLLMLASGLLPLTDALALSAVKAKSPSMHVIGESGGSVVNDGYVKVGRAGFNGPVPLFCPVGKEIKGPLAHTGAQQFCVLKGPSGKVVENSNAPAQSAQGVLDGQFGQGVVVFVGVTRASHFADLLAYRVIAPAARPPVN